MRLALIEIGSRATRLLVVDVEPNGGIRILKKARKQIPLGLAVAAGRQAVAERISEVARQCRDFEQEAKSFGARVACFGTEALRRIRDEKIANLSILRATVLDATMEAECAFWAAVKDPNVHAKPGESFAVIDLGSGSVEIVSGALKGEMPAVSDRKSIGLGADDFVRMFRQEEHDIEKFSKQIADIVDSAGVPTPKKQARIILAGGVATKTAWMKIREHENDPYNEKRMCGTVLITEELLDRVFEVSSMAREDPVRAARFVEPRRIDFDEMTQIVVGNILFVCLLNRWKKLQCEVTTLGPRFGVAYKLALAK
jgi:exopolyphosphatase/pppGpp-phosphohydrolase